MPYGTIKVDTITFTDGGVDKSVAISGLVQNPTFSGNITATGTISGNIIQGGTTVSGLTVTGTTANFASGVFTTQISGSIVKVPAGTAGAPSLQVGTGTSVAPGLYGAGTDQIGISTGGSSVVVLDSVGQLRVVNAGTAAAPAVIVGNDLNSGLYSPGADQLAISTGGTGRLSIDAGGDIFIYGLLWALNKTTNYLRLFNGGSNGVDLSSSTTLSFLTAGSERLRIDSSGRLLVGTSTARNQFFGGLTAQTQIEGNSTETASFSITRNDTTADGNALILAKARGTAYGVVASSDRVGRISFQAADGTTFVPAATIEAYVDGTPGANDMPGRLVFATTADGAASPTERMVIKADGKIGIGTSAPYSLLELNSGLNSSAIRITDADNNGSASTFRYTVASLWARRDAIKRVSSDPLANNGATAAITFTDEPGNFSFPTAARSSSIEFYTANNQDGALVGIVPTLRMKIASDGKVGIGTSSPGAQLHSAANVSDSTIYELLRVGGTHSGASGGGWKIAFNQTGDGSPEKAYLSTTFSGSWFTTLNTTGTLTFGTNNTERARIDSSGRLLVGTSASTTGSSFTKAEFVNASTYADLVVGRGDGATGSDSFIGVISFASNAGSTWQTHASITAAMDAVSGNNDKPGRLVFSTTADGASSPTERLRITSDGKVGIGTSAPTAQLHVQGTYSTRFDGNSIFLDRDGPNYIQTPGGSSASLVFLGNGSAERARIDSSGRLLVGTSTAFGTVSNSSNYAFVQVKGNTSGDGSEGRITLGTTTASASIVAGSDLGSIWFADGSGGDYARILAEADGAGGTGDYPGRLVFSTTADGAATPTERMVIKADGKVGIGTSSPQYSLDIAGVQGNINLTSTTGTNNALLRVNNTGGTGYIGLDSSVGGLGGAYSFNIWHSGSYPIVFANNGTERARIDSSGRLLVGTSSALTGAASQFSKGVFIGNSSNNGAGYTAFGRGSSAIGAVSGTDIALLTFTDTGAAEFASISCYVDGTVSAGDYPGRLVFSTTADGAAAPTEAMRINNQRELLIGTTTRTANGGVLQISNGITFPGTQSACSDPNTLDDYEEGTFTATLRGSTSDPTTFVQTLGEYIKVGKIVHVLVNFENRTTTGAAGNVTVTGLPFSSSMRATGSALAYFFDLNTGTSLSSFIEASSTTVSLLSSKDDAEWQLLQHNAGTGRYLQFAISYKVA